MHIKCRYFSPKNTATGGWNHPPQMQLTVNNLVVQGKKFIQKRFYMLPKDSKHSIFPQKFMFFLGSFASAIAKGSIDLMAYLFMQKGLFRKDSTFHQNTQNILFSRQNSCCSQALSCPQLPRRAQIDLLAYLSVQKGLFKKGSTCYRKTLLNILFSSQNSCCSEALLLPELPRA